MKYKIGDRVRLISSKRVGTIDCHCREHGAIYYRLDTDKLNFYEESNIELAENTLDTLEVGDILASKFSSYQYKVLAICGDVFGLSRGDEFDLFDGWYTLTEIKKDHTLKDSPEITELTLEDIAKLAGKDVSQIKIVK